MLSKYRGYEIVIISLALVSLLGIVPLVEGSRSAFDQGYQNGRDDRLDGYGKDNYCDPDNTSRNPDAACAAYKAGYEAGWLAAGLLYGD